MGCIKSKQGLTQEDLEFLKAHTRYDENTIKEWYKGFKQDCPNGRLTPVKFVDMYKMFFPRGNAEEFCNQIFKTFDTDKIGYLDFKQFILAINTTNSGSGISFIYDRIGSKIQNYFIEKCQIQTKIYRKCT